METEVIERLITEYGKDIYSFCVYLTGDRQTADDLYQQTFLVAMEKGGIDLSGNPKSYLIGIALNINNNRRRKDIWRQKRITIVDQDLTEEAYNVAANDESVDDEIYNGKIVVTRDDSTHRYVSERTVTSKKDVVLMFYTEQLPVQDIANILKISEGTVKSRLHNARSKLKERLQKYAE